MMNEEAKQKHFAIREKCELRKKIANMVDAHFDWIDCPYDCENDYEHWRGEEDA